MQYLPQLAFWVPLGIMDISQKHGGEPGGELIRAGALNGDNMVYHYRISTITSNVGGEYIRSAALKVDFL